MDQPGGLSKKYTFSGSVLFERMKDQGTYSTDVSTIQARIAALGLTNLYEDVSRSITN
jgi:hypothetical protein